MKAIPLFCAGLVFAAPIFAATTDVQYDFNGDGTYELTRTDLAAVSHTYAASEYFPVATVRTTLGDFSSLGGFSFLSSAGRLRVSVSVPPVHEGSALSVTDPVDLKATPEGHLYVLSRSTATLTQFDATHTVVRSFSPVGITPTGMDVDAEGKVYVALSGGHQVIRLRPTTTSFELDPIFNGTGKIGKADNTAGSGNGEFNAPFDVAISPDGQHIVVSDSGNHRLQQFTTDGSFVTAFGTQGSGIGQFNTPKGLAYDSAGYLYVVDSGNGRIALMLSSSVIGVSGSSGTGLGQFQGAVNVVIGDRGIYVADTGNNRVQGFDPVDDGHNASPTPFSVRLALLSAQFSPPLNQPHAITPVADPLAEMIYIADTANNRVIKVTLPETSAPDTDVWNPMKTSLLAGNIDAAIAYFSSATAEDYRRSFLAIGPAAISAVMNKTLAPEVIRGDTAQYSFEDVIAGETITFPVEFVKENGVWKILGF